MSRQHQLANILTPDSDEQFNQLLRESKGVPVVLDFYTKWIPEVLNRLGNPRVQIVRVNVDQMPELIDRFLIEQVPCTMGIDKCGNMLDDQIYGNSNKQQVVDFVSRLNNRGLWCQPLLSETPASSSVEDDKMREWPNQDKLEEMHKYYLFTNEPMSQKPVTSIPGIGKVYANRLANLGIVNARQLTAIYMQIANRAEFEKWLKTKCAINDRWCDLACEAIAKNVRRMI